MKYMIFVYEIEDVQELEFLVYQVRKVCKESIGIISFNDALVLNIDTDMTKEEIAESLVSNSVLNPFFIGPASEFSALLSRSESIGLFGTDIEEEGIEESEDGYVDEISSLKRKKYTANPPTLDAVLDKITSKGIDALTKKEKLFLKNFKYER
jgi:hypothetical protein